jgi:hypothetical protein
MHAAVLAAALALAQAAELDSDERVAGWTSDLEHWLAALEREHYVFRESGVPDALYARADRLRERIPELSDQRILVELQGCASLAGDGHTYVLPFAPRVETTALPLQLYFFADGVFVIGAAAGHERWIGSEVLALGTTPADELVARLADYISRDNDQGIRWVGPAFLTLTGMLEAIAEGVTAAAIPVTLRTPDGARAEVVLAPVPPAPSASTGGLPKLHPSRLPGAPPPPLWLRDVARAHWLEPLDERTLYVQFNQVADAPDQTLAEFAQRVVAAIEAQTTRLVVDVRHNNGGNSYLFPPLIDVLASFERTRPVAELVILTGRNTFSAAQNFIAQVELRTDAVFAGEPSSSRPNFVGEENEVVLPWSGARGSISNRYHENAQGDERAWIEPDIALELTSADYFANRDPLLERVLAGAR